MALRIDDEILANCVNSIQDNITILQERMRIWDVTRRGGAGLGISCLLGPLADNDPVAASALNGIRNCFVQKRRQDLFDLIKILDINPYCDSVCYDTQEIIYPFFYSIRRQDTYLGTPTNTTPPNIVAQVGRVKNDIIRHIQNQWRQMAALGSVREQHILTDVDDTLYPPGTFGPSVHGIIEGAKGLFAGTDNSWIGGTFYPGVIAFHRVMRSNPYTTILTARPNTHEARGRNLDITDPKSWKRVDWAMPHGDILPAQTVNRGDINVLSGATGMGMAAAGATIVAANLGWRDMQLLADKKIENCTQFAALHPNLELIFIGDNGQGDLIAAITLLADDIIERSFIHDVRGGVQEEGAPWSPWVLEHLVEVNRLVFFNNYVDLATSLHESGLLQWEDVDFVYNQSLNNCLRNERRTDTAVCQEIFTQIPIQAARARAAARQREREELDQFGGRKQTKRRKKTHRKRRKKRKTRRRRKTKKVSKMTKKMLLKQINIFMNSDNVHQLSRSQMNNIIILLLKNIKYLKLEKNEEAKQFLDYIIDLGADQGNKEINNLYNELAAAYFK